MQLIQYCEYFIFIYFFVMSLTEGMRAPGTALWETLVTSCNIKGTVLSSSLLLAKELHSSELPEIQQLISINKTSSFSSWLMCLSAVKSLLIFKHKNNFYIFSHNSR